MAKLLEDVEDDEIRLAEVEQYLFRCLLSGDKKRIATAKKTIWQAIVDCSDNSKQWHRKLIAMYNFADYPELANRFVRFAKGQ